MPDRGNFRRDAGLVSQSSNTFQHGSDADRIRAELNGEPIVLQVHNDIFYPRQPFQGCFDTVRSAQSGRATAAFHHAAHEYRYVAQFVHGDLLG